VLLVDVALLAHAALELDPVTLLDHVRGLVRRGVQVRRRLERDAGISGFCGQRANSAAMDS
jgi:hypothetical protein